MKVELSSYLKQIEPKLKELLVHLQKRYTYVSVLATDVLASTYSVSSRTQSVSEPFTNERGCVIRVYHNGQYSEYSFNQLEKDLEKMADRIVDELNTQQALLKELGIATYDTPQVEEEKLALYYQTEAEILPSQMSAPDLLARMKQISNEGKSIGEEVVDVTVCFTSTQVNKMFLSQQKCLKQAYVYSDGMIGVIARRGEKTKYDYKGFSGLKGVELFDEMTNRVCEVAQDAIELLDAKHVEPGEYDIIANPEISGLIAHEAFGHGVEMDMFVKNRALAKDYVGKRVASDLVEMHEGALVGKECSSYAFDDEGVLAHDVVEIRAGILERGICDTLSALRLGVEPTGNGKRESFERKAYTRMTHTAFMGGKDTLEDMIASIEHGYLLEGCESGMEDPKHWGIQCIASKGREIVHGKLTGNIIAPVVLTGYVPDLLNSISMVSKEVELFGMGACGKGYKEWVKVADGGPYLKAKGRLG